MIREAISKVKDAVASKDIIPWMTHYCINDGFIHATNGRLIAAAPFPDDRRYLVPARLFEKAMERMPTDNPKIEIEDDGIKISSGRHRAKIKSATDGAVTLKPEGDIIPVPVGFVEKLKAIRAFVSENATQPFALCVLLDGEHMVATNNVSVVAAFEVGLPDMYSMLPVTAVDFVLGRDTHPKEIIYNADSMSFRWEDGSWMRSLLMDAKFPELAKTLIYDAPQPSWEIPKDWRDVYDDVSSLATSTLQNDQAQVRFYKDKIVAGHTGGEFTVEVETPVPEGREFSKWNPKYLTPVIEASEMFSPETWPKPAPFTGPLVAGVIMGMH